MSVAVEGDRDSFCTVADYGQHSLLIVESAKTRTTNVISAVLKSGIEYCMYFGRKLKEHGGYLLGEVCPVGHAHMRAIFTSQVCSVCTP